ncbi:MAG: DUF1538 domain-containing protein [Methanofastidiosum sp.]|nr:DUF1538 domain-containing protein [Methanofastidiosum sp.]
MIGFIENLKEIILEVIVVLLPLSLLFLIFQRYLLKLPKQYTKNLLKGIFLTFVGMILFFQGIDIGFLPAGEIIGIYFGNLKSNWLLVPLGFMMGFLVTYAEPGVIIICDQIEKASNGFLKSNLVKKILSVSVAFFVALAMVKLIYGVALITIIIIGYSLVILLTLISDREYIAIAFDSGCVVTGPMAITFLMALSLGAASAMEGRDPLIDGFGLIALIALAPVITLMIFGLIIRYKGGLKNG